MIGLGGAVLLLGAAVVVPLTIDRTVDGTPVAGDRPTATAPPSATPPGAELPPMTCDGGDLVISGSAQARGALDQVALAYEAACPDVVVAYSPLGTGAGIEDFANDVLPVAIADRVLTTTEEAAATRRCGAAPLQVPLVVAPVALPFRLSGVDELRLDAPTVAKIFDGRLTSWAAPAIAALNPGTPLPDVPITPVHRSADTGVTAVFQSYLAAEGGWTAGTGPTFAAAGGSAEQTDNALRSTVAATEGAIGYSSLATDPVALLGGVAPDLASMAAAIDGALPPDGLTIDPANLFGAEAPAYPLVSVTYAIACRDYPEEQTGTSVREFLLSSVAAQGSEVAYLLPTGEWAERVRDALR